MAQFYMFFNSTLGDRRRYVAQDLADYFGDVLSTGLLHTDEIPELKASVESGTMNTIVDPGRAIMKGHRYVNTTPHKLEHNLPEPDLDRIDRVVLRLDMRHTQRNILLHIIEGASADNPTPPELQRDDFIYELSLAQIRVRADASTIRQEDLRDERLDEDVCGLVYSLLSIPTSQFIEQWDLFFNAKKDEINTESEAIFQQLADDLVKFNNDWDEWFNNQKTEGFVMASEKGEPDGVAGLDGNAKVPVSQLPAMDYVPIAEKGEADGVATLDSGGNPVQKPYVTGFYTGNDAPSRTINLGFRPKAVYLASVNAFVGSGGGGGSYSNVYGGFLVDGASNPVHGDNPVASIVNNGFTVYFSGSTSTTQSNNVLTNYSDTVYHYIAFR